MIRLRKEIQDFASSCERLLSPCMTPGEEPLTEDERQLIGYYLEELSRLTTSVNTTSKS
jgi:hypothetical protein